MSRHLIVLQNQTGNGQAMGPITIASTGGRGLPAAPSQGINLFMDAVAKPQDPGRPKPEDVLQRVAHVVSEGAAIVDNIFARTRSAQEPPFMKTAFSVSIDIPHSQLS